MLAQPLAATVRGGFTVLCALATAVAATGTTVRAARPEDGIALTVTRDAAGQVVLDWTGARPAFEVYRAASPVGLTASFDRRIALTRDRHLTDAPAAAPLTCYVVGPRWPQFFSSDAAHDDLLNDLLARHARAEYTDDSLKRPDASAPGWATVTLWREWELDELLWHDYSLTNYPLEDRAGWFAFMLAYQPVDRFGYYWSGIVGPEAPTAAPNCCFRQGWPFPSYYDSQGVAPGWEWNGLNNEGWSLVNARNEGVSGGEWHASTTKKDPQILSPSIAVSGDQAPFVDFEIQYDALDVFAQPAERVWRFWWQTSDDPAWTLDKSVTSDTFPLLPLALVSAGATNGTFHLPLHMHPKWSGHTITRLRLDPIESTAPRTATWRLNFLRLDYDTRMSINNPIFVRTIARKLFWDGDTAFFAGQLTRARQATQFMLTHMHGAELGFLDHGWFPGHDGLGWMAPGVPRHGHGLENNWFDIVTTGPRDLLAGVRYVMALEAMAEAERYVEAHPEIDLPRPTITGPDGSTSVPCVETSATLAARAAAAKAAVHAEYWNPATGRYANWRRADGTLVDYGFVQGNVEALAAEIPPPDAAASILDWLDGRRIVAGDTSTGADIYANGFAARANTVKNDLDWIWGWTGWTVPFADQVEDGGSSLHTTSFDVRGRLAYGDVAGAWTVWTRMLDHHRTVREFGGKGANFYRDYYAAHPELGSLQGCGVPGGIGLDCEFVENMLTPAAWLNGWLGVQTTEAGVLRIAPVRPPQLAFLGARSVIWRGHRLDLRAEDGVLDLTGSTLADSAGATLELVFRGAWPAGAGVLCDGAPAPGTVIWAPDALTLRTPLAAARFAVDQSKTASSAW